MSEPRTMVFKFEGGPLNGQTLVVREVDRDRARVVYEVIERQDTARRRAGKIQ